ncbi:MAG: type IX secretion system membrane protein PorP/SprF [Bacteroidetes bacterium]|nr:type IX secretion system membrane protein PorP/SprF [Bacteroidota bacterium]
MKKTLTFVSLLLLLGQSAFAQQEPMFTKYMFNSLVFNPGYAGSKEYLSLGLLHRTQWYEIDGAPITQSLTAHTPLRNERVGVGFSVVNDIIGPTRTTGANLAYAYRIPFGKFKLSIGLQAGVENYKADWTSLNIEDPDPVFQENVNKILPNFGMGLYFYNKNFYFGVSSPHLVEYDLRNNADVGTGIYARQVRHFYLMTGVAIPLNGDALVFKPSFLWKNVGFDKHLAKLEEFKDIGAPNEFDIDLSLLFQQTLWVGASFRSAFSVEPLEKPARSSYDSADIWVSFLLKNGMRLGAAYDYPLTELSNVTSGAFEIMLGYEFDFKEKKVVTPRYF